MLGALTGSLVLGHWSNVGAQALAPTGPSQVQLAGRETEPPRLALLIGNRDYPDGEDLPPVHKNVRDLGAALERRGFAVTQALDLDRNDARELVKRFSRELDGAPADATVFFYFTGHGAQVEARNLLVSAHQNPKARSSALEGGSLILANDVVVPLARRPRGLTIAVIDACRTSLTAGPGQDGLNQVEAPPGCLIAFATGAGKPAIAPVDAQRNTFYTGSLVKLLDAASDEITFSDLFKLVKADVQQTMQNHPVPLLRHFAQVPFIAENAQTVRRVAPRRSEEGAGGQAGGAPLTDAEEKAAWDQLERTYWPAEVVRLATEYVTRYPSSPLTPRAEVTRDGAREAARVLTRQDVRLYRSAFVPTPDMQGQELGDLAKAGRGDKDAAARLGRWFVKDASAARGPTAIGRFEGWMQYASALGNGIASYELALYYRKGDQPHLASQFEQRSSELGYTPPPSLDNTRK